MRRILAGAIAAVCLSPITLRAEVVRFDIVERQPAFAGRSFGDVGPYERITARATIALDPSDDRNAVITDLAQAPRNPGGKVEATADVVILRPTDPARGNGTLLLDVPNRGLARAAVRRFIAARREQRAKRRRRRHRLPAPPGLHDGLGRLAGRHPFQAGADGADGAGAEGRDRACARGIRFRHHGKSRTGHADLARGRSCQPHRHRSRRLGRRAPDAIRPLGPPRRSLNRRGHAARRFRCRRALRDHHTARDPVPLGMGFAAVRDVASFLRRDTTPGQSAATACIRPSAARSASASRNPAASCATSSISASTRISGPRRVRRPDAACRRHPADGDQCPLRLPGRNPRHPQDPAWQADLFPFTYATLSDPISGKTDGLLRRCCALSVTCPRGDADRQR